eukprot:6720661-Heterocapsa_arctica.AAC.1
MKVFTVRLARKTKRMSNIAKCKYSHKAIVCEGMSKETIMSGNRRERRHDEAKVLQRLRPPPLLVGWQQVPHRSTSRRGFDGAR